MLAWLLGGSLAALVTLYMVRPRSERYRLSSARFFRDLPPIQQGRPRLRLSNPLTSRAFFLQLLVLLILLKAAITAERTMAAARPESVGVWIALDTSASMSAIQDGESRIRTTCPRRPDLRPLPRWDQPLA